jgi:hypothetical protein
MSYYYGQPLVHCFLLHAEWLASEASEDVTNTEKVRLMEKVVDASIKAGADAQSHLLKIQISNHKGRDKKPDNHLGSNESEPEPLRSSASYLGTIISR